MPPVGGHRSIEGSHRKIPRFSLPGVITIAHLLLWVVLFIAQSALADAGGVIVVDASNRLAVTVHGWLGFLLTCPLYALIFPRGLSDVVWLDIAGIVANSLLVGFGLAGGIRLVIRRQFGLRFLFVLTTLAAISLHGMIYTNGKRIILFAATLALATLAFASLRQTENAAH